MYQPASLQCEMQALALELPGWSNRAHGQATAPAITPRCQHTTNPEALKGTASLLHVGQLAIL